MTDRLIIIMPPDPSRRTWGRRPRSIARRVVMTALGIAVGAVLAYAFSAARAHIMNECTAPAPGYALHWSVRAGPDGTLIVRCRYEPELDA